MSKNATPNQPATKTVMVRLAALTMVEYEELITVPADFSEVQLQELAENRWNAVDGGEFYQGDNHTWQKHLCQAVEVGGEALPEEPPSLVAYMRGDNLVIEREEPAVAPPQHLPQLESSPVLSPVVDLATRAALAEQFYLELSDQHETFAGIGEDHGVATLANLFHIHWAILSNGFVQVFENAEVIGILKSLPSNERWLKYVYVEG